MQHGHGQGQGGYQQEAYGKAEPGLAGNQHQPQGHGGYYANAGAGAGQTQYYGPQAAQGALPGHQQGHGAQGQGVGVGAAGTAPPDYSKFRTAVPISALSSSAAPVDCPSCHQRAMTATKLESGNTTK